MKLYEKIKSLFVTETDGASKEYIDLVRHYSELSYGNERRRDAGYPNGVVPCRPKKCLSDRLVLTIC